MPRHRDDFRPARALLASPYPLPTFIATPKPPPPVTPSQASAFTSIPPIKLVQSPTTTLALHHGFPYNPNWKNLPPAIPPVPYPSDGGGNNEEREARRLRQRVKRRFGKAIGLAPIDASGGAAESEEEIMSGIEEARSESGLVPSSATPVFDHVKHEQQQPAALLPAASINIDTTLRTGITPPRSASRAVPTPFGWDSSEEGDKNPDDSPKSPILVTPRDPNGPIILPRTALSSISPDPDPDLETVDSAHPTFFGATNLQPFTSQPPPPKSSRLNYDSEASSIDCRPTGKWKKIYLQIPRGKHTRERFRRQRMETSRIVSGTMSDSALQSFRDNGGDGRKKGKGQVSSSHLRLRSILELETRSVIESDAKSRVDSPLPVQNPMGLDTVAEETEGDGENGTELAKEKTEEVDPWTPMHIDPRSGDFNEPSWPHPLPPREGGSSHTSFQSLHATAHGPHHQGIGLTQLKTRTLKRPSPLAPKPQKQVATPREKIIPVTPLKPISPVHPLSRGLVDPSLTSTSRQVNMPSVKACQNFLLALRVQAAKRAAALREHNRRVFERAQREGMALCCTPGVVIGVRPVSQLSQPRMMTGAMGMGMPAGDTMGYAGMGMGVPASGMQWTNGHAQPAFTNAPTQAMRSSAPYPAAKSPQEKYPAPGQSPRRPRKRTRFATIPQPTQTSTPLFSSNPKATFSTPQPPPRGSNARYMETWTQPQPQMRRASENDLEERRSMWLYDDRMRAQKMAMEAARVEAQARAGMADWAFRETIEDGLEEDEEEEGDLQGCQMLGKRRRG